MEDYTLVRPTIWVKDRDGYESRVAFHLPDTKVFFRRSRGQEEPISFNGVPCEIGNTICIMYANQHNNFMDGSVRIRVEVGDTVSVSPSVYVVQLIANLIEPGYTM